MHSKSYPWLTIIALVAVIVWATSSLLTPDSEGQEVAQTNESKTAAALSEEQSAAAPVLPGGGPAAQVAHTQWLSAELQHESLWTAAGDDPGYEPPAQEAPQVLSPRMKPANEWAPRTGAQRQSDDTLDQPADERPLSISGTVLNGAGEPVTGIEVVARAKRLFSEWGGTDLADVGDEWRTSSGAGGSYRFAQLADGEYELRAEAVAPYEGVSRTVRAGIQSADLVLRQLEEVWVYGTVTSTQGEPLADVRITQSGRSGNSIFSDSGGDYGLFLAVDGVRQSYLLRYKGQGYRPGRVTLYDVDLRGRAEVRLDAELEREDVRDLATVLGTVNGTDGQPVSGARVTLRSPRPIHRYYAETDATGAFRFPQVATGDDYQLRVQARDYYKDHSERGLAVTKEGLDLAVELEPLLKNSLAGQLVDAQGRPVPGFSLWLRCADASNQQPLLVRSDQAGYFFVDGVPEGPLRFETRSAPYLQVVMQQSPSPGEEVQVPIGWGDYQFGGQVVDAQGDPVPGSQIHLYWSLNAAGVSSSSTRSVTADANGYFQFTRLGPGPHIVNVKAPGFENTRLEKQVGTHLGDVRVTLR